MATQAQLTDGDLFEGHRIVGVLGSGGMAIVYEAVEVFTQRPVAIKVMKARYEGDEHAVERARAEVVTLCKLDHPNLMKVYRADVLPNGCVWMSMPVLIGSPLRIYAHGRGPMAVDEALEICAQIADGVAAAHEIRVIHRDLKPENVMISAQGHVVVFDFNASKFFELGLKSTIPGKAPGTPQYMAPEQFRPKYTPSFATDIYQLGCILYELLAGKHPLRVLNGELPLTMAVIMIGHTEWNFVPLTKVIGCSEELWQVVKKALEKNPAARYAKMPDFAQEMRAKRRRWLAEQSAAAATGAIDVTTRHASAAPGVTSRPGGRREHWPPFELPEHATGARQGAAAESVAEDDGDDAAVDSREDEREDEREDACGEMNPGALFLTDPAASGHPWIRQRSNRRRGRLPGRAPAPFRSRCGQETDPCARIPSPRSTDG